MIGRLLVTGVWLGWAAWQGVKALAAPERQSVLMYDPPPAQRREPNSIRRIFPDEEWAAMERRAIEGYVGQDV